MSKVLGILLLLVVCNQVVSTDPESSYQHEMAKLRYWETQSNNAGEEVRAKMQVYSLPYALRTTTDGPITTMTQEIAHASGLYDHLILSRNLERQKHLTLFAHLKMLLRIIVNVYKYHDIDAETRKIDGPAILTSLERQMLLERAASIKKIAKSTLNKINRIFDDGMGYKGRQNSKYEKYIREINAFGKMVQDEKLKRDSLASNSNVELMTKDEIEARIRKIQAPFPLYDFNRNGITVTELLLLAHTHEILFYWASYAAGFSALPADIDNGPLAAVFDSFLQTDEEPNNFRIRAEGHLGVCNEYVQKFVALAKHDFVGIDSDLVNGYKLEIMPELHEYIMVSQPKQTSDDVSSPFPDLLPSGSRIYDRGGREDSNFGDCDRLLSHVDGASSSASGGTRTRSVDCDRGSRKSVFGWSFC
ncbi:hypothetical protein SeLEV6574_g05682 [Synchytrium endobioticum]|uniref:Uncharacterized protein n=1 Tax=Synchytrium endobioticum TaxID=286115 RepID=A0A507CT30_9FUNG|nr:hypothetical protein SeLEV6574_g05682 [Synchytrium endobioticum]